MEYIDDDLVSNAVTYMRAKQTKGWLRLTAIAACLCIVLICVITFVVSSNNDIGFPSSISSTSDEMNDSEVFELPPLVYVNNTLYKRIGFITRNDLNDECVFLGNVTSNVPSSQEPSENFQTNDNNIGAEIYKTGNDIIIVYNDYYELYCVVE